MTITRQNFLSHSQEDYVKTSLVILIFGFLFFVFSWPSLTLLFRIYETEDDYAHGFMIPLVSTYAACRILKKTDLTVFRPSRVGLPFIFLGIATVILGYWYYIALFPAGLGYGFILASGLLLSVAGCFVTVGGLSILRVFIFPIIYLIFAIPFPKSITLPITLWLRNHVSEISESVIRSIGITVFREGNVLYLVNTSLGVEDACSGIRSFWILMAGASALGFILRIKLSKAIILVLLTLPISMAMNIFRIVITAFSVSRLSTEYSSGWRHDLLGLITFAMGLTLLVGFAMFFSPKENRILYHNVNDIKKYSSKSQGYRSCLTLFTKIKVFHFVIVGMLFTLGTSASYVISNHYDSDDLAMHEKRKLFLSFPDQIGPYTKIFDAKPDHRHLKLLQPTDFLIRHYRTNKEHIELRMVYWEPLKNRRKERRHGLDNHIPDICYPAWGYKRIAVNDREMLLDGVSSKSVSLRFFHKADQEECVLFWYSGEDNLLVKGDLHKRIKFLIDSWKHPFLSHGAHYVISVIVRVKSSYNDAQKTAIQFAQTISTVLPEYGLDP